MLYWQELNFKEKLARLAIVAISPIVLVIILYNLVGWGMFGDLPATQAIKSISNPIASELYTSNDKLIGRYYIENRTYLKKENINELYKNALIATEDHRFYKHKGVDYRSLGRVLIKSIFLQKDASGGGSTITQQLAKNLYPREKHRFLSTIINKFREIRKKYKLNEVLSSLQSERVGI